MNSFETSQPQTRLRLSSYPSLPTFKATFNTSQKQSSLLNVYRRYQAADESIAENLWQNYTAYLHIVNFKATWNKPCGIDRFAELHFSPQLELACEDM